MYACVSSSPMEVEALKLEAQENKERALTQHKTEERGVTVMVRRLQ